MTAFDLRVDLAKDDVATIEFTSGSRNYFSSPLIGAIADAMESLPSRDARAIVLRSTGRHFCAGADFSDGSGTACLYDADGRHLYEHAERIVRQPLPIVVAVQGSAVGGGLGLALMGDLRVGTSSTRLVAPFARLGLHHGFGLSVTLARAVGEQRALDLLLTGRDVRGPEALSIGLLDRLVDEPDLTGAAEEVAATLAALAPIAVRSMRRTMRAGLAEEFHRAVAHERREQDSHARTHDHAEALAAFNDRRAPRFQNH